MTSVSALLNRRDNPELTSWGVVHRQTTLTSAENYLKYKVCALKQNFEVQFLFVICAHIKHEKPRFCPG